MDILDKIRHMAEDQRKNGRRPKPSKMFAGGDRDVAELLAAKLRAGEPTQVWLRGDPEALTIHRPYDARVEGDFLLVWYHQSGVQLSSILRVADIVLTVSKPGRRPR